MERVKFRATYRGDKARLMFEQQEVDGRLWFVCMTDPNMRYGFEIPFLDEDWLLLQYIDRIDNCGAELYEGDIAEVMMWVEVDKPKVPELFTIAWSEEEHGFRFVGEDGRPWDVTDRNDIRRIGNRLENPELLKP